MATTRRLYHFVNCKYGIEDILKQRIKVSRIDDSNDPFELLPFEFNQGGISSAYEDIKNSIDRENGYLCLSSEWSNPVMWSHYADKHRGICLGLDVQEKDSIPSDFVNYVSQRIKFINGVHDKPDPLFRVLFWTKFEHWQYENEFRLIVPLANMISEGKLLFFPFDNDVLTLKEIIIGPRNKLPVYFGSNGLSKGEIRITETKLSDAQFQVVAEAGCNVNLSDIRRLLETAPIEEVEHS